ncbi:aminoglycoside phosphotransferase family protein [Kutzneria sp. CA-103260]|uniref:aminoglycoside phosphotransferase family protein n=1 Tax=Kutzneria sp. CA-103260 TaxID=2802641 RepID=UPI001BAA5929|nr:aminoglycoside phosphotransferase family protein [Kutzneria sp. CA-103260]QUQ63409.1 Aminoglycoside/hydroxyurea antibiotic resistance kinase [Kutzneria sp. CA-103260]
MIVHPVIRRRAEQEGPVGEKWLADLDSLLAIMADRWSLTVGEQLHGGFGSVVFRVRTPDRDAVLKLSIPGLDVAREAASLGHPGYAQLYACDPAAGALLLESLGPYLELPAEQMVAELGRLLRIAWRPTDEPAFPKADSLAQLITDLWRRLAPPYPDALRDQALAYAANRAVDTSRKVVVHGDPHCGNALRGPRGYVFVDPECFACDPAYDCGVVLRQTTAEEFPALCRQLAEITELPYRAIAEWTFIERVSSGLYLLSLGDTERAQLLLDAALVSAEPGTPPG